MIRVDGPVVLDLLQRAPYADWVHTEWAEWGGDVPRRQTLAERIAANSAPLRDRKGHALREVAELQIMAARARAHGRMPDAELRMLAKRRAALLGDLIAGLDAAYTPAGMLAWLNGQIEPLQGRPFAFEGDRPEGDQLRGFMGRARCPMWWRRQLRRAAVLDRETEANRRGEVNATKRQPYVTHDTLHRHQRRKAENDAMMAAQELENDAGQVMTLADLAAATTSNKAIRRGELMTRIAGCERLAEHLGLRGVFLTLTAPSRFHAVHRHGGKNERHDGSTPRDAQGWLCAAWARARAKLQRLGLLVFGFRVAEPHHDGCPHWHALLWAKPELYDRAVDVIRAAWLKLEGAEPGAAEHRCKAVDMRPGGASGYIAKYIAKNIDDAGSVGEEGHYDDGGHAMAGNWAAGGNGRMAVGAAGGASGVGGVGGAGAGADQGRGAGIPVVAQGDLFGGTAQRVEAWASAWGIRQFQAIGQPPVTVWRELRRVPEQARGGATPRLSVAFEAVNREGVRRADWAAYVLAQGGLWTGRKYLLRIAQVVAERVGRYETTEQPRPVGVVDSTGPGDWHLSQRREWRPRGTWSRAELTPVRGPFAPTARPWTRVNNCTQLPGLEAARRLREAGMLMFDGTGGGSTIERTHHAQPERHCGRPEGPT